MPAAAQPSLFRRIWSFTVLGLAGLGVYSCVATAHTHLEVANTVDGAPFYTVAGTDVQHRHFAGNDTAKAGTRVTWTHGTHDGCYVEVSSTPIEGSSVGIGFVLPTSCEDAVRRVAD